GDYTVGGFSALINNMSTSATTLNASFAVVVIYEKAGLQRRQVTVHDGLLELGGSFTPEITSAVLTGLEVANPAQGDLTWYVLDGDPVGNKNEAVVAKGLSGGAMLALADPPLT